MNISMVRFRILQRSPTNLRSGAHCVPADKYVTPFFPADNLVAHKTPVRLSRPPQRAGHNERKGAVDVSFDYQSRHIGIDTPAREHMLKALGFARLTDLIDAAVPESVRSAADESLIPPAATEEELLAELATLSQRNNVRVPMMGRGYYRTHTPAVLRRNVLENPAWYTAYTPYQPEISQGRLEALLVFQTMVADLAGLKTANASLLDEPTAAAEAMAMSRRISKNTSTRFLVSADTHPQTIAVLHTRAEPIGLEIELFDPTQPLEGLDYFGILISYPGASGAIPRGSKQHVEAAHDAGAVVSVASDLLALTLLTPPGEWGADIVVGSAQRFGIPLGFGGQIGRASCRERV